MTKISILYFSGSGHTAKMAGAGAKGARTVANTEVRSHSIRAEEIDQGRFKNEALLVELDAADALIFGSPTYMGGPAAQFKAFADATAERWFKSAWKNKLAAGFTVSGGPSGDKLSTLHYFFTLAMQHGMIWVGLANLPTTTAASIASAATAERWHKRARSRLRSPQMRLTSSLEKH